MRSGRYYAPEFCNGAGVPFTLMRGEAGNAITTKGGITWQSLHVLSVGLMAARPLWAAAHTRMPRGNSIITSCHCRGRLTPVPRRVVTEQRTSAVRDVISGLSFMGCGRKSNTGRGPENCGAASPVPQSIVNLMLNYIPSAGLIQHEWSAHGTCSELPANDYFASRAKGSRFGTVPVQLAPHATDARERVSDRGRVCRGQSWFSFTGFRANMYRRQAAGGADLSRQESDAAAMYFERWRTHLADMTISPPR